MKKKKIISLIFCFVLLLFNSKNFIAESNNLECLMYDTFKTEQKTKNNKTYKSIYKGKNKGKIIIKKSNSKEVIKITKEIKKVKDTITYITLEHFLEINSAFESSKSWDVANKFGYVGKYQLGELALLDMGYDIKWIKKVKKSIHKEVRVFKRRNGNHLLYDYYSFDLSLFPPKMQEEAIKKYINKIERDYLGSHIRKYVGKEVGGVRITKAGILGASFFGIWLVDSYLKSDGKRNPRDGNGVSIKYRLIMFENYELI